MLVKEGVKSKAQDIAMNMLENNYSVKEISNITGLSEEEIKNLQS
jgi:hypothetical protein